MLGIPDKIYSKAAALVLVAGAALRLVIWWQNRSLFIDEANLIRNFSEKSYTGFFTTLGYDQFAPPLFCAVEKAMLDAFGQYEQVARLLPLLAGFAALWLFRPVAMRWLQAPALLLAAVFFAFGEPFFRYATEAKQYSGDVFAALLLLWLATDNTFQVQNRHVYRIAALSPVLIWCSMPVVFVTAAIGMFYLYLIVREKRRDLLRPFAWLALGSGASFWVYYALILHRDAGNEQLQHWHVFMPFPPLNGQQAQDVLQRLLDIRTSTLGYTAVSTLVYLVGLIAGVVALYRRRSATWMLLVLPVLLCMAASALRQYSMVERLTLFFMPLVLILLAIGWQWIFLSEKKWLQALLLFLVLAAAAGYCQPQYFIQPYRITGLREALQTVAQRIGPGEQLYIQHGAQPVTHYYTDIAARPISLPAYIRGVWDARENWQELRRDNPSAPLWIVWDSAQTSPPFNDWFGATPRISEQYVFEKCKIWKVEW